MLRSQDALSTFDCEAYSILRRECGVLTLGTLENNMQYATSISRKVHGKGRVCKNVNYDVHLSCSNSAFNSVILGQSYLSVWKLKTPPLHTALLYWFMFFSRGLLYWFLFLDWVDYYIDFSLEYTTNEMVPNFSSQKNKKRVSELKPSFYCYAYCIVT